MTTTKPAESAAQVDALLRRWHAAAREVEKIAKEAHPLAGVCVLSEESITDFFHPIESSLIHLSRYYKSLAYDELTKVEMKPACLQEWDDAVSAP